MRKLAVAFIAMSIAVGLPHVTVPAASAQESFEDDDIVVIQQRPFIRKGRFELSPFFAVATNETLFLHLGAGVVANYHILENLFVGGSYVKYFTFETDLFDEVQEDYRVYPELWELDFFFGVHVAYAPIYGKAIVANSAIVHYDVYLIAGAGVTRTSLTDWAPTGNFGVGTRFFLTRWLTLNLEVQDYIFQEEFNAGSRVINNVMFHVGLSFFMPDFSYRMPK